MWELCIPLLPAWRANDEELGEGKCFSFPVPWPPLGHKPTPPGPWLSLPAGKHQALGEEGGKAAGAQPYLDGRLLAGLLGFFSLQSPPSYSFPLSLLQLSAHYAPLNPPLCPSGLLHIRQTRDSVGKG